MNYFEFYSGDYQRDTADLSLAEHGAFLMLLATYYSTERPIPAGNPTLFRLVRAMDKIEQDAVISVADRFFPISPDDNMRHNARADREILKARARIDVSRNNGKKGGRPLKQTETQLDTQRVSGMEPSGVPASKAPHTPHAIQEERSKSLEQPAARKTASRFEEFWNAYPIKKGRAESEAKWKAKGYDTIADRIIADVKRRVNEDRQWIDGYAPHGSTYVNARGWEDDIEPVKGSANGAHMFAGAV